MSLTKVSYSMINGAFTNVLDFGADLTGTNDSLAAIQAAITEAGNGGTVYLPKGTYKTSGPILAENVRGVTFLGESGQPGWAGSRIIGAHTGKAIISLVGSLFCSIQGLGLEGDVSTSPQTGLLLGRSSASSAGNHMFIHMSITGTFSVAGLYNVASEDNDFYSCYIVTAGTSVGVFMSQGDTYSIGGLTGSSMEHNSFFGGNIGCTGSAAGTALYIDSGMATGHIHFYNTFFIKNGNDSFIYIRLGGVDGGDTTFPIGFHDCSGEHNVNQPTNGLHIISVGSQIRQLNGFTATNLRLQTPTTNHILCDSGGGGSVVLIDANISTPYSGSSSLTSTFQRVDYSVLSMMYEDTYYISDTNSVGNILQGTSPNASNFTDASLLNSWSSTYGASNGYYAPGYVRDQLGFVHLRGLANGGTVGLSIFTLPGTCRPSKNLKFSVNSNGAFGSLTIESSGNVILDSGSNAYVSLDGIVFQSIQ
jgi:hypothetical protein